MREWKTVPSPTPILVRAIRVCHRLDARCRRRNFIAARPILPNLARDLVHSRACMVDLKTWRSNQVIAVT
jgi:hypothetical protein